MLEGAYAGGCMCQRVNVLEDVYAGECMSWRRHVLEDVLLEDACAGGCSGLSQV